MQNSGERLTYPYIARGIAMLCIVIGHLGRMSIARVVFPFHVPVFYLLSGFFLSASQSPGVFIRRKARTLLVPYVVTCAAIIALSAVINEGLLGGEDTLGVMRRWAFASLLGSGGDLYNGPFFMPGIGALWFLLATFWGLILLRLLLNVRPAVRIAAVIGIFALSVWSERRFFQLPLSIQPGGCALLYMYIGWLARQGKDRFAALPRELRAFIAVCAVLIWIAFSVRFESFWLVHCDIGRGIIDVFGSLCASYAVILFSQWLDRHTHALRGALSYLGQYSLVMLCAHIIELDVFPWYLMTDPLLAGGMSDTACLLILIAAKFIWIIPVTLLLSRWNPARRVFGYPPLQRGKATAQS